MLIEVILGLRSRERQIDAVKEDTAVHTDSSVYGGDQPRVFQPDSKGKSLLYRVESINLLLQV